MKKNSIALKLAMLSTAFVLAISGIAITKNKTATEVEATQHTSNYALYSYSGTYYDSIDFNASAGLNGQLRQALTSLIYPKSWYTYSGSGETHLSTQLQYADEDPTNSNNMVYLYTRDSVKKNAASSWNREHVWPQSLSNGCWGESKGGTDILHIRPTYNSTNSSRSNDKYCDVNKDSPREYNGMIFGYGSGTKFEPLDSVKGDVARIIMYVWVAYNSYYSNLPPITNVFESYDTLLKWHTQDKPDVLEGNRNNYAQSSNQKNRNPFVDHPELGWKIFGDSASTSIKNACMEAYPADGYTPTNPSGQTGEETTVNFSVADYATANSISSGTSTKTINPDSVVTLEAVGTDANTGKIYIGTSYTEWRFYKTGTGTLKISVPDGYSLISATGKIGTENWGTPTDVTFTVSNNMVQYNPGTNFNVKSLSITYAPIIQTVEPTGVSLNTNSVSLNVGGEKTLIATIAPEDASASVTWSSSNESVATVDQYGKVTAVAAGTATITAKVTDNIKANCIVNVTSGGGTSTGTLEMVSSIEAGDTVYLTANAVGMQYTGPSSTSTIYGVGESFENQPDSSRCALGVETGSVSNSFAFKIKEGTYANKYLSWSSGNSLETSTSIDSKSSWKVTFDSDSNATIANAGTTARVIWWNVSSPRFACYTDKTNGTGYKYTQLWKSVSSSTATDPEDYLSAASSYATLHGTEAGSTEVSYIFANQNYTNAELISEVTIDSNVTLTCSKGQGGTSPAYYDAGSGLRIYSKNTMVFNANNANILKIEFTFESNGSKTGLSVSSGSLSGEIWNGDASTVTFTNTNSKDHFRISSIKVTYYQGTYSLGNVAIRFGASISAANWNAIKNHEGWNIADYGVMLVKKATLTGYGKSSVEEAYRGEKTVAIINKTKNGVAYADPYLSGNTYSFTARVSFARESDYSGVVCAAPFVVAGGEYHFLDEVEFSVNTLANHYLNNVNYMGGSSLSNKALTYLSTAH